MEIHDKSYLHVSNEANQLGTVDSITRRGTLSLSLSLSPCMNLILRYANDNLL